MSVQDNDLLLVERNGKSYNLEVQNMSNLRDDDLLLVERAGKSYKVTYSDSGLNAGSGGFEEPVEVLTPFNGAGIGLNPDPYDPISSLVTGAGAGNGYYNIQFEDSTNLDKMVGPVEMRMPDGSEIFPETSAITAVTQATSGTLAYNKIGANAAGGASVQWVHRMYMGQPTTGPHAGQDMLIILAENNSTSGYREFWYSLDYGATITKFNMLGTGTQARQGTNVDIVFFKGRFIIMSKNRTNLAQFNISTEGSNDNWDAMPDPRETLLGWDSTQTSTQVFSNFKIINSRLYMWASGRPGNFNLVYLDDWDEGWKLCTYSGEQINNLNYSCGQYILHLDKSQGVTGFSDDGINFTTVINDPSYRGINDSPPEYIIGYRAEEISYDGRIFEARSQNHSTSGGKAYDQLSHVFYNNGYPKLKTSINGFDFVDTDDLDSTPNLISGSHGARYSGLTKNGETIISFIYASRNNGGYDFAVYRVNGAPKTQEITFADSKDFNFLGAGDAIEGTSEFVISIDSDNNKIVATNYTTTFTNGQTLKFGEKEAIADTVISQTGNSLNVGGTNGLWYPGTVMFGQSITDTAPSPDDVVFTSMNGGSSKVTGSNVTLDSRTWTLQEKQGGNWVTVADQVVDTSALASQDGATPWNGRPTLKPSTEYRVLVTYNSSNSPSSTSTYNTFTTGV